MTVTLDTDDGSIGELRYEVGIAKAGDTIKFGSQLNNETITLDPTKGQIKLALGNLTIDGTGVNVTISGGGTNRIFEIASGVDTINNLSFTNGSVTGHDGGAMLVDNGVNLTLNNDTFTNNVVSGSAGGGALADNGTLVVNNCTFSSNKASENGGAIYAPIGNSRVSLKVQGCTFTSN